LETEFAELKGAPHAVAVSSCTAGLHVSLVALKVGPGDEVITTPMTYWSTISAIVCAGAKPVLADCDRGTFNILPEEIHRRITGRTKAIVVVHMCGRCCDMDPIMRIARSHGLPVVEDCAHAVESVYHGVPAGLIGQVGCFSFYATKNVTTAEGGMVITRSKSLAAQVRALSHVGIGRDTWTRLSTGSDRHYNVVRAGFKYNMPDLNAAVGLAQLARLPDGARRRREIWRRYDEELRDSPCVLPALEEPDTTHALHLYTPLLRLEKLSATRDQVMEAMEAENIGTGVHFVPIHLHRYCRRQWKWRKGDYPNAEFIGERALSLPLAADLTDETVGDVCRALRRILRYYAN
jgi:dTDP-4-amino-4,6-dideoxygalactose transaminase